MHEKPSSDGRRRRSEQSRDKIVAAMLELTEEGAITPTAEDVAARAGVGLRSVFRRFKDMESLYHEMAVRLSRHYEMWLVPFETDDWRAQLAETVDRRLTTFEKLMPFRRAADAHRHESPMIQAEHDRIVAMMRARLKEILPPEIAGRGETFEALDLLLSIESWQRLRLVQGLPVKRARALIESQVAMLTADL